MDACRRIQRNAEALAATPPEALPPEVRGHLEGCAACARALAATRLARGLVAAAAGGIEPPAGFAERVLAALPPARPARPREADVWRPAWGLLPAFAGVAAALCVLFLQAPAAETPAWPGLPAALSAGERLVLGPGPADDDDLVLTAVVGEGGR